MTTFKQSTIYTHQFLMISSTDHISGKTGVNASLVVKLGKNGATGVTAGGTTAEVDSTNLPGVYSIAFTTTDTNTVGSFALAATATGCDPTNEFHRIDPQIFPDLSINASGQVFIASNLKQNQPAALFFTMTVNGVPTAGLSITGQRNFGSGFSGISGTITDLTGGDYKVGLLAADTNSASAMFRFTAAGADDRNITIFFDP